MKEAPYQYRCPITHQIMKAPVTLASGNTFQRSSIMLWFASGKKSDPLTNLKLPTLHFRTNLTLRKQIQEFNCKDEKESTLSSISIQSAMCFGTNYTSTLQVKLAQKKQELKELKNNFQIWEDSFQSYLEGTHRTFARSTICYHGEMKDGLRHGKGICCYSSGDSFKGEWFEDKYNGKGVFTTQQSFKEYGEWKEGEADGLGIAEDQDGYRYEGDMAEGKKQGLGIIYKNGHIYFEGEWKNGLRHGRFHVYRIEILLGLLEGWNEAWTGRRNQHSGKEVTELVLRQAYL